ncbi:MAG: hypothetical protein Q9174_007089, partial [Haloplaca sp. 1 TL-2023]
WRIAVTRDKINQNLKDIYKKSRAKKAAGYVSDPPEVTGKYPRSCTRCEPGHRPCDRAYPPPCNICIERNCEDQCVYPEIKPKTRRQARSSTKRRRDETPDTDDDDDDDDDTSIEHRKGKRRKKRGTTPAGSAPKRKNQSARGECCLGNNSEPIHGGGGRPVEGEFVEIDQHGGPSQLYQFHCYVSPWHCADETASEFDEAQGHAPLFALLAYLAKAVRETSPIYPTLVHRYVCRECSHDSKVKKKDMDSTQQNEMDVDKALKTIPSSRAAYRFLVAVRTLLAALNESKIAGSVPNQDFVRGFEFANVDFGIILSPQPLEGTRTDRLMTLRRLWRSRHPDIRILPVEAKDIGTNADQKGNLWWGFHFSPAQFAYSAAVIVSAASAPDFVAFIPFHYLRAWEKLQAKQLLYEFIRPFWTLHPPPAFPPELSPFIVPLAGLGKALDNMRDFHTGVASQW